MASSGRPIKGPSRPGVAEQLCQGGSSMIAVGSVMAVYPVMPTNSTADSMSASSNAWPYWA